VGGRRDGGVRFGFFYSLLMLLSRASDEDAILFGTISQRMPGTALLDQPFTFIE
jgi:hypothetical protein